MTIFSFNFILKTKIVISLGKTKADAQGHNQFFLFFFSYKTKIVIQLGKTKADAQGDVLRGLEVIEHCASAATLLLGDSSPQVAQNVDVQSIYAPLGIYLKVK